MKETKLNKVLNYMKQYVENKYEHDSEPMLTYKDLQIVLNEIERLNNIINEYENWLKAHLDEEFYWFKMYDKLQGLKGDSSNE